MPVQVFSTSVWHLDPVKSSRRSRNAHIRIILLFRHATQLPKGGEICSLSACRTAETIGSGSHEVNRYSESFSMALRRVADFAKIQQLDFVSERRRWESKKAQEAPSEDYEIDEELFSDASLLHSSSSAAHPGPETSEADYILALEEYEFQRLIASMDQDRSLDNVPQHYGSDDEDYDQIFMECVTNVDSQQPQQPQDSVNYYRDVDDMDMTDG